MHSSTSVTNKAANLLPLSADNTASPIRTQEQGSQPATFANLLQRHTSEPARNTTDEVAAAREQQARQPERSAEGTERERERSQAGQRTRDGRDARMASAARPAARQAEKAEKTDKSQGSEKAEAKDKKVEEETDTTDPAAAAGANGWFAALAASRPAAGGSQPQAGTDTGKDGAKATAEQALASVTDATAQPGAELAAAMSPGQPPAAKPAAGGVEPGAAKTLAVDERSGQSAKQAATGAEAVNMLGAAADAAQDGGQAAGGAHSFESALLAAQAAHQTGGTHGTRQAQATEAHVETPVGSPGFADALGEQVRMLVTQAAGRGENATLHEAKLSLNPAELGPITIRIALEGQQAQVEFTAASELTRRAIEDSLPQLAGALQSEGLTLAGGGVYEQRQQPGEPGNGGQGQAPAGRSTVVGVDAPAGLNDSSGATPAPRRSQGAVDLYA